MSFVFFRKSAATFLANFGSRSRFIEGILRASLHLRKQALSGRLVVPYPEDEGGAELLVISQLLESNLDDRALLHLAGVDLLDERPDLPQGDDAPTVV